MSKVRVRPPNKKRHDEHIEQLANAIKEKDSEIKLSQEFVATNEDSLGRIREEKNALYRKKQKISDSVAQVNKTRSKEFDALTKIKSHLPCRNETSLTQRIERLEQQMICNSYSLQEEKRLVNEISALKKSFHTLKQAQAQENKCHDISNQQKELREHRDDLQKMITKLKEQEQGVKVELLKHKGLIEQLTADVGELREERRQAGIDYRNLVKEYGEQQKRKRFVNAKQKEQAKKEAIEKHERELAEYEAGRRPNEDEIQQCETLIQYLQSLTAGNSPPHAQSDPIKTDVPADHVGEKVVNKAVRVNEEASFEGMELLKHNDNDAMYGAKPKIKSGKKNKRKHNTNKSIRHTSTEIFAQFEKVHVKTPLTMADIPHAIHDLKKKLLYYNEQSPLGLKPSIHAFRDSDSDFVVLNVSSDCLSQPESALAESIVSTPEILLHDSDNPLVFPSPPSPGKLAGISLQTSSAEDSGMEIGSEEFNPKAVQELLTRSTVSESTHYSLSTDFPPISSTIKTSSLDMSTIYDSVHEIASDAANDNTTGGLATGKGGVTHANELTNMSCDQNVELNGNSGTSETDSEDAKTLSEASEDVRVLSLS